MRLIEAISRLNTEKFTVEDIRHGFLFRWRFFAKLCLEMGVVDGVFETWIEENITYYKLKK